MSYKWSELGASLHDQAKCVPGALPSAVWFICAHCGLDILNLIILILNPRSSQLSTFVIEFPLHLRICELVACILDPQPFSSLWQHAVP